MPWIPACNSGVRLVPAGPGAQWLLQRLAQLAALEGGIGTEGARRASENLVEVGVAQQSEIRQRNWTLAASSEAAARLNGAQHAAYLEWLWSKTHWEPRAGELGRAFGYCLHVVSDRNSADRRWTDLSLSDQRVILAHCVRSFAELEAALPRAVMDRLEGLRLRISDLP